VRQARGPMGQEKNDSRRIRRIQGGVVLEKSSSNNKNIRQGIEGGKTLG